MNAVSLAGSETILLVEDEPMVRRLFCGILRSHGYTVVEASDGREALAACRISNQPIHLVVTDVVLPGLSGMELEEETARLDPAPKVLYMSGYPEEMLRDRGFRKDSARFLPKPFPPDALVRTVRQVLDSRDGQSRS